MARGPVKHTCPDIDRAKKDNDNERESLLSIIKDLNGHTLDDIIEAMRSAARRFDDLDYVLEDLRDSNDSLRTWGAEMEDKADQLESQLSEQS